MKAHVCIGGPLDGQHAASIDFHGQWVKTDKGKLSHHEDGMFKHLDAEYVQFHNAHSSRKRAAVVWIHTSLLVMPVTMRNR